MSTHQETPSLQVTLSSKQILAISLPIALAILVPQVNFVINNIAGLPVVELRKTRLGGWGKIAKRIFDLVVSALLIIILSPILLAIAIAVKLDSPGTVFFIYKRIHSTCCTNYLRSYFG